MLALRAARVCAPPMAVAAAPPSFDGLRAFRVPATRERDEEPGFAGPNKEPLSRNRTGGQA